MDVEILNFRCFHSIELWNFLFLIYLKSFSWTLKTCIYILKDTFLDIYNLYLQILKHFLDPHNVLKLSYPLAFVFTYFKTLS